jgi:hypothetical protein
MVTVQLSNAAGVAQVTTAEQDPATGVIVAVTGTPAITGEIVSRTMTFTLRTTVFPEASVAVTTTGVVPTENTEPLAGLIVTVAEQLSEAVTPGIATTRLHWFPETYAVMLELAIVSTGLMVSSTVTVAVAVPTLPLASIADRVTVLAPTFEQLKVDLLNEYDATVQLSVVPLFTAAVVSVAVPEAFKYNVAALVTTVGAVLSTTVTTTLRVRVLPFTSVAVTVTVFAPRSAHVKAVLLNPELATPQLSEMPAEVKT